MLDEPIQNKPFYVRAINKIPVIGPTATFVKRNIHKTIPWYLRGTLVESGWRNSSVFRFKGNMNDRDSAELEITKIDRNNSLFRDRTEELQQFFGIGTPRLMLHYLRNGTPNTRFYRHRMELPFSKFGTDANSLKKIYEATAFMQSNRYMLTYAKYRIGQDFLKIAERLNMSSKGINVLDYGCGMADPSLLLALHGANVTLVDLADSKFEFTEWRFKKRGLNVRAVGATETELPVDLGSSKYDLVIMCEVLEHVRNPRLFLQFGIDHLESGGVLFESLGKTHQHGVGGSHLVEAKDLLDTTDYGEYHEAQLESVNEHFKTSEHTNFYFKRDSRVRQR